VIVSVAETAEKPVRKCDLAECENGSKLPVLSSQSREQ
jgi:hypothetical protein